jgi:nucleotide-binding universal stress UspA family protein
MATPGRAATPEALTTIVAGIDLSAPADHALDRAIAIAAQHRAKLIIVHAEAEDAPGSKLDRRVLTEIIEVTNVVRTAEARHLADRQARAIAAGVDAEVVSRVGVSSDVIAAVATERAAQLIVLGTQGRTGIARFLLGSVAAATLRVAPCDVLVVRGAPGTAPFVRPLVATDFSPAAALALAHVTRVIAPTTPIELVHAWELPMGSWGASLLGSARYPWSTVRDAVLASAKAEGDALIAAHAGDGHAVHLELVQGQPSAVVTQVAERGGHDLIAVGTHGHRGFRRLLLGSCAETTIRHAPCSVLVVHSQPDA